MTGPASKEPNSAPQEEKKEGPASSEPIISKRGFFHFINENKWEIVSYVLLTSWDHSNILLIEKVSSEALSSWPLFWHS
jgi:hypothetical protein